MWRGRLGSCIRRYSRVSSDPPEKTAAWCPEQFQGALEEKSDAARGGGRRAGELRPPVRLWSWVSGRQLGGCSWGQSTGLPWDPLGWSKDPPGGSELGRSSELQLNCFYYCTLSGFVGFSGGFFFFEKK